MSRARRSQVPCDGPGRCKDGGTGTTHSKWRTIAKGIYVSATTPGSGKSLVALGLADTLHRHADRIGFFKPVGAGPPGRRKMRRHRCPLRTPSAPRWSSSKRATA
ncbi:AAA family ATPase [Pseudarthrobacter sp. AL07]|nr:MULTISPECIES: AAA family ATPase [unclassified Pseudarthrobacter]MDI3194309.1 AAA family ATPase [Pseudarthrobacter sp. AL20]MDI3208376.1 AAA family ATPase [Pseudarthrobacter sp. AL07]